MPDPRAVVVEASGGRLQTSVEGRTFFLKSYLDVIDHNYSVDHNISFNPASLERCLHDLWEFTFYSDFFTFVQVKSVQLFRGPLFLCMDKNVLFQAGNFLQSRLCYLAMGHSLGACVFRCAS